MERKMHYIMLNKKHYLKTLKKMKKIILAIIATLTIIGCNTTKIPIAKELCGTYICEGSSKKIELLPDGTYILYNPPLPPFFDAYIERSDIASKGRWNIKSDDVIEIISENYYLRQKGYDYELKKERKYSQDSLYMKVILPN